MGKKDTSKKRSTVKNLWMAALAVVGVIAIAEQLRLPKEERTWHGKVGFVPYEFRRPTVDRFKKTYWNEEGPIVSPRLWGVGWAVNVAAIKKRVMG